MPFVVCEGEYRGKDYEDIFVMYVGTLRKVAYHDKMAQLFCSLKPGYVRKYYLCQRTYQGFFDRKHRERPFDRDLTNNELGPPASTLYTIKIALVFRGLFRDLA